MAWLDRLAGALALLGGLTLCGAACGTALAQTAPPARTAPRQPAAFERSFVRTDLASAAVRLEAALKAEAGGPLRPAGQSRAAGQALLAAGKPGEARWASWSPAST